MAKHKVTLSDELRQACREYADHTTGHQRGMRGLADASGIDETRLSKFVRQGHSLSEAAADTLAAVLGLGLAPAMEGAQQAGTTTGRATVAPADIWARLVRDRIVRSMRDRGLTQVALAARWGKSGPHVSRLLTDPERYSRDALIDLANAAGLKPRALVGKG